MFFALAKISFFVALWVLGIWTVTEKNKTLKYYKTMFSDWAESPKVFAISQLAFTRSELKRKIKEIESEIGYNKDVETLINRMSIIDSQILTIENSITFRDIISKPLILCPVCMSSFHSLLLFIIMFVANNVSDPAGETSQDLVLDIAIYIFSLKGFFCWVYVCLVSAYFNHILYWIYRKTNE